MKRPLIHFAILMVLPAAGSMAVAGAVNSVPAKTNSDAYEIIARQNIFDASRDPNTNLPPPPPKRVDSFMLTGTMTADGERYAFFEGNRLQRRNAVVASAGKIEGFTIAGITTEGVRLESAGQPAIVLRVGGGMTREDNGPWKLNSSSQSGQQP